MTATRSALGVLLPSLLAVACSSESGIDSAPVARRGLAVVGGTLALDDTTELGPSPGHAAALAIATDGQAALAVWCDQNEQRSGVLAARLAADGSPLDSPPLLLPIGSCSSQAGPAVAYGSQGYVVVGSKGVQPGVGTVYDLLSVVVGTDGSVSAPIDVVVADGVQTAPALALAGDHLVLAWQDRRDDPNGTMSDVFARHLDLAGAPLGSEVRITQTPSSSEHELALASDGVDALVAWTVPAGIEGSRLAANGTLIDTSPVSLAGGGRHPTLAFASSQYFLAHETPSAGSSSVEVRSFDTSLTPGASATVANRAGVATEPTIAMSNGNLLVAWAHGAASDSSFDPRTAEVRVARLQTDLTVIDTTPLEPAPSLSDRPVVTGSAASGWVAWVDDRGDLLPRQIYAAAVPASGALAASPDHLVSLAGVSQRNVQLSADPDGYLAVWQELRGDSAYDLVARRVSADGSGVEGDLVTLVSEAGNQYEPTIVFDGQNHLVAFTHATEISPGGATYHPEIHVLPVSPSGQPLGAPKRITAEGSNASSPHLAFGGDHFYLTYASSNTVEGQLLDLDANPVGAATLLHDSTSALTSPSSSWGGSYLVVFSTRTSSQGKALGMRVDRAGNLLDPQPIDLGRGSETEELAVAFGGGVYLVVWSEPLGGTRGVRVRPDGLVLDSTPIEISDESSGFLPAVVFDGSSFVVAGRYGADVQLVEVSPDGRVLAGPQGFTEPVNVTEAYRLGLASTCAASVLVGHHAPVDAVETSTFRAFVTGVSSEHAGAATGCEIADPLPGTGASGAAGAGGAIGVGGSAGLAGGGEGGSVSATPESDGGCGCRTAGHRQSGRSTWVSLVLGWLLLRRRSRSRR